MTRKLPTPPADPRAAHLPATLTARMTALATIGTGMHALGDHATAAERKASSRREQRQRQSLNKAARAAATAAETTLFLGKLLDAGMTARKATSELREAVLLRAIGDGLLLLDDLAFEAAVIRSYKPQARGKKEASE